MSAPPTTNNLVMPPMGLGLWKSAPGEVKAAIKTALGVGYRLFDGAAAYGNEKEVGEALNESITAGTVTRDEVFVVSKLFNTMHVWGNETSRPHEAIDRTLADLQLDYIDLYLMHWPVAIEQKEIASLGGLRLANGTPNPALNIKIEFLDTWREMLRIKASGKKQIQAIIDAGLEAPAVNQCEFHPYLQQKQLQEFCQRKGIQLMAYSPLGSGDSYSGTSFPEVGTGSFQSPSGGTVLIKNSVVASVASSVGKTPAQVLLRWSVQQGFVCLPKSVTPSRIASNTDIFNWEIPDNGMRALEALDCGFRYGIGYCKGHYDCPHAPW